MKASFVPLLFAALVVGSPLGDRAVFKRHTGVSRSFVLRSNTNAPLACSASAGPPLPPPVSSPATSTTDNSTIPDVTGNATLPDTTLPDTNSTAVDNSTSIDTSTGNSTNATTTASRRHLSSDLSEWQVLCSVSGGGIFSNFDLDYGLGCTNWAGIDAVSALYAEADPCEQQLNADFMITWAKEFGGGNAKSFIARALDYRRYPRRVVKVLDVIPSSPYCLLEPVNVELIGVYNEQFPGVDYGLYGGPNYPIVPFGGDETCPLGWNADVSSCSCVSAGDSSAADSSPDTTDSTDSTADSTDSGDIPTSTDSVDTPSITDSADASDSTDTDAPSTTDSTDASDSTDAADTVTSSSTDSADTSSTAATDTATLPAETGHPNVNDPNGR